LEVKSDSEALRKNRSLILVGNVAIAIALFSSGKSKTAIAPQELLFFLVGNQKLRSLVLFSSGKSKTAIAFYSSGKYCDRSSRIAKHLVKIATISF
jgi:hypothetical protein